MRDPFYGQLTEVKSKVSADQYHMRHRGSCSLTWVMCFSKLTADKVMDFHWIAGSGYFPNY